MTQPPYTRVNHERLLSPVVLSIPHAGRDYRRCTPLLAVPVARLAALEDRHADLLAVAALAQGASAVIAHAPRLWIDLNRAESDLDAAMVAGARPSATPVSPRVRSGLGLIPRRLAGVGPIWRSALTADDVAQRIAHDHRPYHAALAALVERVRDRFGAALLLDLHSMPALPGPDAPAIVIGDRFGTTAGARFSATAEAVLTGSGFRVAANTPYAGGHIVTRHGAPQRNIHALQIEIDRDCYLNADGSASGKGLARVQAAIGALVAALGEELFPGLQVAAE